MATHIHYVHKHILLIHTHIRAHTSEGHPDVHPLYCQSDIYMQKILLHSLTKQLAHLKHSSNTLHCIGLSQSIKKKSLLPDIHTYCRAEEAAQTRAQSSPGSKVILIVNTLKIHTCIHTDAHMARESVVGLTSPPPPPPCLNK